jgi:hypothetical protein
MIRIPTNLSVRDKYKYYTEYQQTHKVLLTLKGHSKVVERIPDATFGLATSTNYESPGFAEELTHNALQRMLLHPKSGLIADPSWGRTDLVFPFAVYEAKGWDGDCRDARRQACAAPAVYLDLVDNLARTPARKNTQGHIKPL